MKESSSVEEKPEQEQRQLLKDSAFRLLTRREHSRYELRQKLVQKGWPSDWVNALLEWLQENGWQSDQRFIESFVRDKLTQGQGRLKIIAQATQQRGIARDLVEQTLAEHAVDWRTSCRQAHARKFGEQPATDKKQWAKRVRYLQQRGFSADEIFAVLDELGR